MLFVARELRAAFHELFTTRRYRLVLIGLVLIAAFISVSELAVAKLFTKIILHEGTMSHTKLAIFVTGFFLFLEQQERVISFNVFIVSMFLIRHSKHPIQKSKVPARIGAGRLHSS